jgi:hypothetical protein
MFDLQIAQFHFCISRGQISGPCGANPEHRGLVIGKMIVIGSRDWTIRVRLEK